MLVLDSLQGSGCEFRHSENARFNPRDCWYWLNGNCLNPICSFRHPVSLLLYSMYIFHVCIMWKSPLNINFLSSNQPSRLYTEISLFISGLSWFKLLNNLLVY